MKITLVGKKKPCDCLDWEFGGDGVQIFANVVCVLAEFAWPPKFSESCITQSCPLLSSHPMQCQIFCLSRLTYDAMLLVFVYGWSS